MILLNSTASLEVFLAGAITTNQGVLYAAYADIAADGSTFAPGLATAATNDTTAVELVEAPASGVRQVKFLSLYNADTAAITATLQVVDNATDRVLVTVELASGERLEYTDGNGFRVLSATGALRSEGGGGGGSGVTESIGVACSDETTALTTGTAKATFRMPYGFTLSAVRASVTTAPTGSALTVDINASGASILSTKLTIDAGEETSTTAAVPAVISDSALADDEEITIDIDGVGSTIAGAGLKVWLIGTQA